MKLSRCLIAGAFALAASVGVGAIATASPFSAAGPDNATGLAQSGKGLVQKVYGCHKNKQHHMVYLWGYPAWHRHAGNCQPVPANPPGYGGYPGYVPYHCHRGWQSHFHQGWGGGWHKHVGQNCYPVRGRVWQGGPRHGCINIAGVWICG